MKRWNHLVLFALTAGAALAVGSTAAAQDVSFLDLPAGWIRAIIAHEIWTLALAALVAWEAWLYGVTKSKLHLIGGLATAVALAFWVARSAWLPQIAPGITF